MIELGRDCDECGGSGELPDDPCWLCGGSGVMVAAVVGLDQFRSMLLPVRDDEKTGVTRGVASAGKSA